MSATIADDWEPAEECMAMGHREARQVGTGSHTGEVTWWYCDHCDAEWEEGDE